MHGCKRTSGTCAATVLCIFVWMLRTAAQEIRGVSPIDLPKYRSGAFHCLHDHGASQQLLPVSAINDEFCDCSDGSDEPGTSACAGQQQTLFYCKNERSDTKLIYTSRVNDGICDCCDGSDEWRAAQASSFARGVCPNTCEDEGNKLAEERGRREADVKSGIEQRKKLEELAKAELVKHGGELSSKKQELEQLEAKVLEAKATLESVTALYEAASQAAANTSAEDATDSQGHSSGNSPDTTVSTEKTETAPQTEKHSIEEKYMEGDATEASAANADPTPAAAEQASSSDDTVVSEYTKWMDGAEKTSGGQEADSVDSSDDEEDDGVRWDDEHDDSPDVQSATSSTSEEQPQEEPASFLVRQWSKVRATALWICGKIWTKCKPHAQSDKEVAEQVYADLQQRVTTCKAEVSELEKKIETFKGEDVLAFMTLDKRCISMKDNQYKWELCFFEKAKQDHTSLGKWEKWERPAVGVFENGEQCWGGPQRSLRVLFHCGPKEEIYDVSEPSRCSYEAHVRHPAACTEEVLQALWPKGPRMPNEEL